MKTKAGRIPEGGFFRKKTGSFVYKRISDSSAKFLKLNKDFIFGVTHNGNVAYIHRDKTVVKCTLKDFVGNFQEDIDWHRRICQKECTCDDTSSNCEVHPSYDACCRISCGDCGRCPCCDDSVKW